MADYNCPVGMLVTQDEYGDYVPFLMQVRDKEIIWDMDMFSEETFNAINNMNADVVAAKYPLPSYTLIKNGWIISVEYDGTIEARKEIKFNDSELVFTYLKPTNDVLSTRIDLPFRIGEFPAINTTFNAGNEDMYSINQKISIIKTDFGNISGFNIILQNPDGNSIDNYTSSSVFISIKGKIAYE